MNVFRQIHWGGGGLNKTLLGPEIVKNGKFLVSFFVKMYTNEISHVF